MKYSCDMIKDLLPLYLDGACSGQSKRVVEEHLAECASCSDLLIRMQDTTFNDHLQEEKREVMSHYAKNFRKKSLLVGLSIAGLSLLVCLIVNLATGHKLDWFFIVLTSLMVLGSFTAVPLAAEKKKRLWTLGSFTASLLLLLLTCDLYSGGDWFSVAAAGVLLGMSVCFLPCVIGQIPLKGFASRNKGLLVMFTDTILLYVLIAACGFYAESAGYWKPAFLITTAAALLPWTVFIIIRYLKVNGFIKAGLCTITCAAFSAFFNDVITWIETGALHIALRQANLTLWNTDTRINANCDLLILLVGAAAGILLLLIGILRRRK